MVAGFEDKEGTMSQGVCAAAEVREGMVMEAAVDPPERPR